MGNRRERPGSARSLFRLGETVVTIGALAVIADAGHSPREFITRHGSGDWGELDPEDQAANREALELGLRIFSAYRASDGTKIWVITEADRSATTVLLPEEY